jgi:long-chain acyl-CoA synthetase
MDIAALLNRHARFRPDREAFAFEGRTFTFATLGARVNRVANALLGLGIHKGDKVATLLGNCVELYETYWACARIGAVVVPLSPLLQGPGLTALLRDSAAALVVASADRADELEAVRRDLGVLLGRWVLVDGRREGFFSYHELAEAAEAIEPPAVALVDDDPYNIIYSSGTTGMPKGIVLSHRVRGMYGAIFASAFRMTPESVVLHSGSIVFNGAFVTSMPSMYLGCKYVLDKSYSPESFIATVSREKVTHVMMVPSQIIGLLRSPAFDPEKLRSLEMICSVGAPLHVEHKRELAERLPDRFYELYGLTEGFVTILDKNDYRRKSGSVGTPPQFFDIRIVDEEGAARATGEVGEIVGRGPILMDGYYKRPDLTASAIRDGWLHTGDLGYVDEDGFLFLVDRKKDMIISGGVNVYPRDIEEVVARHPSVQEVAVLGIPNDKWGESPVAVVVPKPGATPNAHDLQEWVNTRVAAKYQRLHRVFLRSELPRNVAGKTLKRVLRDQLVDSGEVSGGY